MTHRPSIMFSRCTAVFIFSIVFLFSFAALAEQVVITPQRVNAPHISNQNGHLLWNNRLILTSILVLVDPKRGRKHKAGRTVRSVVATKMRPVLIFPQ